MFATTGKGLGAGPKRALEDGGGMSAPVSQFAAPRRQGRSPRFARGAGALVGNLDAPTKRRREGAIWRLSRCF